MWRVYLKLWDRMMASKVSIKNIMTSRIISVDEGEKVCDAVKKMTERNIESIVVKKNNEFVGILTEKDIMEKINSVNIYSPDLTVRQIMSSPLITIDANAPIGDATKIMVAKNISRLLVEENDKIVGIISQKDVNRETLNVYMVLSSAI